MLFSCSVSYRASTSEPLFRQFRNGFLRSSEVGLVGSLYKGIFLRVSSDHLSVSNTPYRVAPREFKQWSTKPDSFTQDSSFFVLIDDS